MKRVKQLKIIHFSCNIGMETFVDSMLFWFCYMGSYAPAQLTYIRKSLLDRR